MEELLERILTGAIRLPFFTGDLMAMEERLPKSEWYALLILHRRGEATMSDLATGLGAPLSTVTGIGARLERRGLIRRERHPEDRRVVLLSLTPEGRALADQARTEIRNLLARVQSALTPEEVGQVIGLAQKVLHSLQPAPAPAADPPSPARAARRIPIE